MAFDDLPERIEGETELEELLSRPTAGLVADFSGLEGDIIILGIAGKVGPTLARMAKRAAPAKRILGVARFSAPAVRERLESWGVETIACDLLDRAQVERLPKLPNVVYMAGRKFGTVDDPSLSWAMNTYVPALVADAFRLSRIVAFSTLCVYPFARVIDGGCTEDTAPGAVASASLHISRRATAHPAGSFGSTTRSTCATASCAISRPG
jgi:nucleoside-diphosphate-sugar epimerase